MAFNLSGVLGLVRMLATPSLRTLAMSHVVVPSLERLDWCALRAAGFRGIVLDKDNTLTLPEMMECVPSAQRALRSCAEVFGDRVSILSNTAGLASHDQDGAQAAGS
eukprot:NODE_1506_length_1143_cov_71.233090_g1227_i0.p1 GENE.NODE_1506_length_1143_cov_71.233090_g1227_i0~~NODE_1506_length_1143_cov_71.233090_g1227_i0.p1  ORF type:complete len:107 (+),score=29.62 NODE_1506_length_1143_cov_71.233090_g1227_i0:143-463(+)